MENRLPWNDITHFDFMYLFIMVSAYYGLGWKSTFSVKRQIFIFTAILLILLHIFILLLIWICHFLHRRPLKDRPL